MDDRYDDELDHSNLKSFFHKSQRKNNDKSDRATNEQVLDPRTRAILSKLIKNGLVSEINGCISTGKEANVYHACTEDGSSLAIKIYKTSILIFKDRDRYVNGEYRFRHGYCRSNPRKMVKMWAEKEMRNLKRLHACGIPCPEPVYLKLHVFVMGFIGDVKNGLPAPRLKDAELSHEEFNALYWQLVGMIRKMYHECRLVHADLSEYNMLYFEGKIWIIDVGQAVEHDHPYSFDFLRHDCSTVTNFFKCRGVLTLTIREFFDFITNISFQSEQVAQEYLDQMKVVVGERSADFEESVRIDEEVFKKAFIPKRLSEVIDVERDLARIAEGEVEEILYEKITGMSFNSDDSYGTDESSDSDNTDDSDLVNLDNESALNGFSSSNSDIDIDEESDGSIGTNSVENSNDEKCVDGLLEDLEHMARSPEEALRIARLKRKLHKKKVKEENREKRKHKMPKAIKAKLTKKRNRK